MAVTVQRLPFGTAPSRNRGPRGKRYTAAAAALSVRPSAVAQYTRRSSRRRRRPVTRSPSPPSFFFPPPTLHPLVYRSFFFFFYTVSLPSFFPSVIRSSFRHEYRQCSPLYAATASPADTDRLFFRVYDNRFCIISAANRVSFCTRFYTFCP